MKTTSILAHESIKPEKARLHRLILKGLEEIQKGSFRDIADASGLRESQVWKRLGELRDQGYIVELDTKKCPISGRKVTVWIINDENRQLNLF